jgi:PAS domain S-box-containing protein
MRDHETTVPRPTAGAIAPDPVHEIRDPAIFPLRRGGEIAAWSLGGEAVTGYAEGDTVGRPLSMLFAENGGTIAVSLLAEADETGSAEIEAWMLRKDGTRFWAAGTVSAVRGGGDGEGYVVVIRDRTERKRTETALRLSEATYQGILSISSDAVVCVSEAQRITFFNTGAEAIFGYTADEVIGHPLEMLVPDHARARHAAHVREFGAAHVPARRMGERGEISGRRKDGSEFPAEASISKLEVGGTRVFTAVLRDVTERRRMEESLAAHVRDLARSNEELEQFAYVASHDLQEPLRMVASYTQLLARRYRGRLDDDADEFIGFAVDGVTRMQELINDLLAYSRVGAGRGERVPVALEGLLERVLHGLRPAIEEADAVVTSGPLPTVHGDPVQLGQLLQNLIANAVKFRGQSAPRVHVSARKGEGEGRWIFAVQDNGIGIAPEFADRIFVIFQRLHGRAEYPGTGIGLAICRKIVEGHGGTIHVESEPGEGSTFVFTLSEGSRP